MLIKSLSINNLRNIESVSINLHPSLNYLVGDNGAGKTSVLESIVVLAKGRSFRSGNIASLIGPERDFFQVVAKTVNAHANTNTLGIERSSNAWKARRNGNDVPQLSDLAVDLPLVLIEPNSHRLISGAPDDRRRFMDWGVFHVEPDYLVVWRRYARALKQRNAALRKQDKAVIASLDELVCVLGERIAQSRKIQVKSLAGRLKEKIEQLCPALGGIKLKYDRGWKTGGLRDALRESLLRDMDRGSTGPGPHRADLNILLDGRVARERLSRGEQKLVSSALLLSQASLMAETGETPLLLLDDLASEFDRAHLSQVLVLARALEGQVIITGTNLSGYAIGDRDAFQVFHVEHGKIDVKTST